jgi:hypothetical protein
VTVDVAGVRKRLGMAGVLDRDVLLPGEATASLRQGALRVVNDDGWQVRAEDYGESILLARTSDEAEALEYVVERLTAPLPAPLPYPMDRLRLQWTAMARMTAAILATVREKPDVVVETELPEGAVVDRWGTFDGVRLHPAGTPVAARSLPPDALEPRLPDHGLLTFGVVSPLPVLAGLVAPAFGQPGGGLVFRLAGDDPTVRDAVRHGRLRWLAIQHDPGGGAQ